MNPLCVLDFYVYEKCQRSGYGKIIFSEMIKRENIEPRKLGYDRPSIKFINFLKKYYNLVDYVTQNNNYIVFKDYFYDDNIQSNKNQFYQNNNDLSNIYYGGNLNQNYSNTMKNNYQDINNQKILDNYYYQNSNNQYSNFKNINNQYSDYQNINNQYSNYKNINNQYLDSNNNPYSKSQKIENEYYPSEKKGGLQNTQKYNYQFLNNNNNYNIPVKEQKSYFDTFIPNSKYRYQSTSSEYGSFLNYDKK